MATSSSAQPNHSHRDAKHRQRPQFNNLNVEVPAVATSAGWFTGCFRPSPTSSSPSSHGSAHSGHGHTDRPASPSLIRSPSAWIKAKGQSFGSGKHTRRRSRDLHYDALSYARNFDEGGTDGEAEEETRLAASDALKHRCFTSRLPTSPPQAGSPGLPTGGGHGKSVELARENGRDLE